MRDRDKGTKRHTKRQRKTKRERKTDRQGGGSGLGSSTASSQLNSPVWPRRAKMTKQTGRESAPWEGGHMASTR